MAGRKGKYTPEIVAELVNVIQVGGTDSDACVYVGISQETFYTWVKTKPEFLEQITRARVQGKIQRIARISKAAKDGDWRADAWYLERRWPEEFAQQLVVKLTSEQATILKRHGLTPMQAVEQLINALSEDNVDANR